MYNQLLRRISLFLQCIPVKKKCIHKSCINLQIADDEYTLSMDQWYRKKIFTYESLVCAYKIKKKIEKKKTSTGSNKVGS